MILLLRRQCDRTSLGEGGILAGLRRLRAEGLIEGVSLGMNANRGHKVVRPGSGEGPGTETGEWLPEAILDIWRAAPEGTFDHVLLAYS